MRKLCHLSDVRTVHGINATSRLSVGWEGFWRRGLAGRRGGCRGESQKEEEKSLIKLLQSAQVMPSACCLPRCLLPASACQQGARQGWGRWACLAWWVGGLFIKLAICPTTYLYVPQSLWTSRAFFDLGFSSTVHLRYYRKGVTLYQHLFLPVENQWIRFIWGKVKVRKYDFYVTEMYRIFCWLGPRNTIVSAFTTDHSPPASPFLSQLLT